MSPNRTQAPEMRTLTNEARCEELMNIPKITLIGGPTALIEIAGFRFVTDPTFDEPGEYKLPHVTLIKTSRPALSVDQLGTIDAMLLSHDQHVDNLDTAGRAFVKQASPVFTTTIGADRLGGSVEGLRPWQSVTLSKGDSSVKVTATPARHGPAGIEPLAGDVIGFVLEDGSNNIYVTGDTVWYDGVAEVARRFKANVRVAPIISQWIQTMPSKPRRLFLTP